jgi:simple sugar transport system ATP-binding protein
VDIAAAAAIHAQIRAARGAGAAVLLVSADLQELLALSDRIAVLYRGRVAIEMPGATASVESLGERMGGLEAA